MRYLSDLVTFPLVLGKNVIESQMLGLLAYLV